jgi:type I restriction enzyme S subunit
MTPEVKERIEQVRHGIIPEGYKKSKMQTVPTVWEVVELKQVLERQTEKNTKRTICNILTNSATRGIIPQTDFFDKQIANNENTDVYHLVHPGYFVYNPRISTTAPCGPFNRYNGHETGIMSPLYTVYREKTNNRIISDYLEQFFSSALWFKHMYSIANYGARSDRMNVTNEDMDALPIPIPSSSECIKITKILCTQDSLIESKEQLLAEKQRQKKYLMQQLLTGKKRLPGFTEEWKSAPIGMFLESRNIKQVPSAEAPLMAFIAGEGVSSKGERYDRSHLVKDDTKKYKLTELNDFIYSSNNLDVGSIGLNKYGTAVISVVYEIFKMKANVVPAVVSEVIQMPRNMHHILSYRQGAFYGQYRIFAEDFLSVPIRMPGYEEQIAIGQVLNAADKEIELLRQSIEQEKQKKKALMQLLLTGIVRV